MLTWTFLLNYKMKIVVTKQLIYILCSDCTNTENTEHSQLKTVKIQQFMKHNIINKSITVDQRTNRWKKPSLKWI